MVQVSKQQDSGFIPGNGQPRCKLSGSLRLE
jgi:hypothetical protein